MNKRTLLFVLLCAITFFGFNMYFSYQREQKNKELLQQQKLGNAKADAETKAEVAKRMAPLESLPLVPLTTDVEGKNSAGYAVQQNAALLTLAWDVVMPKLLYSNGLEYHLMTKDFVKEGPVLYASKNFQVLEIANVPESGAHDVQLVWLNGSQKPEQFLGVYSDENLVFPLGNPSHNLLALYKTDQGFLPLGFYDYRSAIFAELQELPLLTNVAIAKQKPAFTPSTQKEQLYYVLENPYVQLVFTNVGGALSEINLPFATKENKKSVVNEIGFDRDIVKNDPLNALFPLHSYFAADSKEAHPHGKEGGYYPLLRRGIKGKHPFSLSPTYYALNIVSEYPEMASQVYEVKEFTANKIVFAATQAHRRLTKTYTLQENAPYVFDLNIKVEGSSKGLWLTSGVPEVEIMSNASSPQIQYRLTRKGKVEVEKLDLPKPQEVINVSSVMPDWVVNSNGYLGVLIDPLDDIASGYRVSGIEGENVPTRLTLIDPQYEPYKAEKYPGYQTALPLPTQGGDWNFRIYAGPFEENTLHAVDQLYTTSDYQPHYSSSRTFYGWFSFISEPFAKFLFIVMKFFYLLTHSWGFSIILLTVFLRILLYPLNAWSMKSMYRMREVSPQVQAIQKKYKKDPKKAQSEIMALYREKKVNPFTGCLPLLIQLPFLIGMFDLLKSSFQLRGASFIPGWIDNLTAPDVVFQWKQPIFFIGTQFHLLPIILGVVMFFQQRFSTPKKEVHEMTDQERQQRAMGTIMAVVFTVMFYHFPSGLNIYWLSSMLLGILQQWFTNKMMNKNSSTRCSG